MVYDLWDAEVGSALAYYHSDTETATLIRALVDDYGPDYAGDLVLAIKDDHGTLRRRLSGAELVAWTEHVLTRPAEELVRN